MSPLFQKGYDFTINTCASAKTILNMIKKEPIDFVEKNSIEETIIVSVIYHNLVTIINFYSLTMILRK